MSGGGAQRSVEQRRLSRWLHQYIRLRWLAVAVAGVGLLVAGSLLDVGVVLWPPLTVLGAIALYNALFSLWEGRHRELGPDGEATGRWGRRFALAQVVSDLVALTVLLHFLGGIETPLFLFYLFHVGFAGIMLNRRDAYAVTALAAGLFLLLAGAEYGGWIPHLHLKALVSPDLYRSPLYVVALMVSFLITLAGLTAGATAIVGELHSQYEQRARDKEGELIEIGQRLEELDRMRAFFLALASHDLKTPLAVVANYLQVILEGFVGEVNEKQRRWMERANTRVLELIRLINDFLDVSQLAAERIAGEMEPVALEGVVRRSMEEVRNKAEEKGVVLQLRLPPGLPPVWAAPRRLQQVITNLLDNGIKFSPRHGEVVLEVCQQDDAVQVDVVDRGPGIPSLHLSHVFEDYFRLRRKEFTPGAGLGLSTARRIVEAHGGKIWVVSPCFEDGKGSRFSFLLPCAPGEEKSDKEKGDGNG